jgi:2-polyprenyl-6-hydroxyphenyl methylase/3-demethylubiquinone-9 3-methyltransferase
MTTKVNNAFYDELGDRWWTDDSHAIAILRVEAQLKLRYIHESLIKAFPHPSKLRVLDVACGAGFLTLPLAKLGYQIDGVDQSVGSIEAAKRWSSDQSNASFSVGDATRLEAADGSYDCVLLMDCLEHFEQPQLAIKEAARVLKPGGVLFVHTFNRTWLSWLLAVKAIEWLTRDAPEHIHVWRMFITPDELRQMTASQGFHEIDMTGIRPQFFRMGFWRTVLARRLMPGFGFATTRLQSVGYMGQFRKLG